MSLTLSWWLLALVVGATAPLWIRAMVNRWDRRARLRTDRVLARFERDRGAGDAGEADDADV